MDYCWEKSDSVLLTFEDCYGLLLRDIPGRVSVHYWRLKTVMDYCWEKSVSVLLTFENCYGLLLRDIPRRLSVYYWRLKTVMDYCWEKSVSSLLTFEDCYGLLLTEECQCTADVWRLLWTTAESWELYLFPDLRFRGKKIFDNQLP